MKNNTLLDRLHDAERKHRFLAPVLYLLTAALLCVVLGLVGILPMPWSHGAAPSEPAPAETKAPAGTKPPAVAEKEPEGHAEDGTWRGASKRQAQDELRSMDAILDGHVGVNGSTFRSYVTAQANDPESDYSVAEDKFTDLAKQVTAAPAGTREGVLEEQKRLKEAFEGWQAQVWAVTNDGLDDQIDQMLTSADAGRRYISGHPGYPDSCNRYAANKIETGGSTREDLERKVEAIRRHDDLLSRCSADMTQEQASRLPQQ